MRNKDVGCAVLSVIQLVHVIAIIVNIIFIIMDINMDNSMPLLNSLLNMLLGKNMIYIILSVLVIDVLESSKDILRRK